MAYDVKSDALGQHLLHRLHPFPDLFTVGASQPGWGGGIDVFVAGIKPGTPGRAGLLYCTYLGATGTYVGSAMEVGTDGSIYVGGYGNIGLPSSSNGSGFAGGVTDGFITVMK